MAVYGIGAYYDEDVSDYFIDQNCACIVYGKSEASSLYEMLRRIKIGDIIYIKSFSIQKQTIHIKAIGFVIGRNIKEYNYSATSNDSMGFGRKVIWKKVYSNKEDWLQVAISPEDMKNNVYNNTLYEEYSATVINKILDQL